MPKYPQVPTSLSPFPKPVSPTALTPFLSRKVYGCAHQAPSQGESCLRGWWRNCGRTHGCFSVSVLSFHNNRSWAQSYVEGLHFPLLQQNSSAVVHKIPRNHLIQKHLWGSCSSPNILHLSDILHGIDITYCCLKSHFPFFLSKRTRILFGETACHLNAWPSKRSLQGSHVT